MEKTALPGAAFQELQKRYANTSVLSNSKAARKPTPRNADCLNVQVQS
jgi:hypothetical protein